MVAGIKLGGKETLRKINKAIKDIAIGDQFSVTIYRADEFRNLSITKPDVTG